MQFQHRIIIFAVKLYSFSWPLQWGLHNNSYLFIISSDIIPYLIVLLSFWLYVVIQNVTQIMSSHRYAHVPVYVILICLTLWPRDLHAHTWPQAAVSLWHADLLRDLNTYAALKVELLWSHHDCLHLWKIQETSLGNTKTRLDPTKTNLKIHK